LTAVPCRNPSVNPPLCTARSCALCHKTQEANCDTSRVPMHRVRLRAAREGTPPNEGLGPLLLVRVSAISNAWVHSQCAVWSPEVRTPNTSSHTHTRSTSLRACASPQTAHPPPAAC
jgi:hypothetical protein